MDDNTKALGLFVGLTVVLFLMGWAFNNRTARSAE